MKKLLTASLVATAALGLAACSSEETTQTVEEGSVEAAAEDTMQEADTAAEGVDNAIAEAEANAEETSKSLEQTTEDAAAGVVEAAGDRAADEVRN